MKKYRKFCLSIVVLVVLTLVYNALVWNFYTKGILTRGSGVIAGDLARTGYLPAYSHLRVNSIDLPRRHTDIEDYKGGDFDLLTIGDSFSNGGAFGKNRYYQDYIASIQGLDVLNVRPPPGASNFIEAVVILANSGFLEKIKTKYVLVELVERSLSRLLKDIDYSKTMPLDELERYYRPLSADRFRKEGALPPVSFLNSGNLKFGLYQLGYLFSDNAFVSMCYKTQLDRPLFTGYGEDTLLFLYKDIRRSKLYSQEDVEKINANMNQLADVLKEKNIKLFFMPAVNKYTLYYKYLEEKKYPSGRFFEMLENLPKSYAYINTKDILLEKIEMGEKDVFFKDDGHWSWKASEAIFKKTRIE